MKRRTLLSMRAGHAGRLLWTACALIFAASMICQPKEVFEGATMGLKTWWNIVFPSLLPFFIVSDLLMSFGLVNFIGVLAEPLMRPLFNVPGSGSFVLCVGYTSGYPIGAMVTARLRSQRLCTRVEAERLMSFTNNSSPLFMLVAVSVGMFGRPDLGLFIAGSHYMANLTLGFLLRFYGRNDREILPLRGNPYGSIFTRAVRELTSAWQKETRPLGKIIGDAVRNAINSLLVIGGFIILFAVIIKLITRAGLINGMAGLLGVVLYPLGFSPEIMPALASGFFEMTIGSKMAAESSAPIIQQLVAVEIILAWSGLSVQAQVASMISETDIRMLPFILSRIAHAALAAFYTVFLFGPAIPAAGNLLRPVMAPLEKMNDAPAFLFSFKFSILLLVATISAIIMLSTLFLLAKKIKTCL
ncbi:MAG: sporulation integral membrane protein YlbJ [Bacillota bacterium]